MPHESGLFDGHAILTPANEVAMKINDNTLERPSEILVMAAMRRLLER
jgi:hypothetical protein